MSETELVDVVNDLDEVVGRASRAQVHADGRLHRGIHVFLFDSRRRLLVQKRSRKVVAAPGMWDCAVSGHVKAGRDFDFSAAEEMAEELGIKTQVRRVAKFRLCYGLANNKISVLYEGTFDSLPGFDAEEVAGVKFVSLVEAERMLDAGLLTVWFEEMLRFWTGKPNKLEVIEDYR